MKKKKRLITVLSLVLMLNITGCSLEERSIDILLENKEDDIAHETLEKLLEAMKNKNKETITNMFASSVLKEMDNPEEQIVQLIKFYDGRILKSYDDGGGIASGGEFDKGESKIEINSSYDIVTDKDDLVVGITEFVEDTENPSNIGIHYLYIRKKRKDENRGYVYWGDDEEAIGIYIGK